MGWHHMGCGRMVHDDEMVRGNDGNRKKCRKKTDIPNSERIG